MPRSRPDLSDKEGLVRSAAETDDWVRAEPPAPGRFGLECPGLRHALSLQKEAERGQWAKPTLATLQHLTGLERPLRGTELPFQFAIATRTNRRGWRLCTRGQEPASPRNQHYAKDSAQLATERKGLLSKDHQRQDGYPGKIHDAKRK